MEQQKAPVKGLHQSVWAVIAACLLFFSGFFFSSSFILPAAKEPQPWQEVSLKPAQIIREMATRFLKDSVKPITDKGKKAVAAMIKLRDDSYNMPDSAFEQLTSKKFFLRPDSLSIIGMNYLQDTMMRLNQQHRFVYADTLLPNGRIEYRTTLSIIGYSSLAVFISKYPAFGLWLSLLIMQAPLYIVFIGFLLFWFLRSQRFPDDADSKEHWLIPGTFLGIAALICFSIWLFIHNSTDDQYVREIFFIKGVHQRMNAVNFPGYLAAILCLSGMLLCAYRMYVIKKTLPAEVLQTDKVQLNILRIRKTFNTLFFIVALVLSLAVFSTGMLYSGLNSLDYVKQLNKALGYQVYRYDLVYMYGILHSFILLIVYMPAKAIIDSVPLEAAGETTTNNTLPSTIIKKTFEVLVASSPLIAGFLQAMLDHVFG